MPLAQPLLPAFQNFSALNALTLGAAWDVAPERAERVWNGIVDQSDSSWVQRFSPLIQSLMTHQPSVRPPKF